MFQYSSKSLFCRVNEELKILFLLAVFAASFIFSSFLQQALLFLLLFTLLAVAGYRDFVKLFVGLLPFLLLADAGFFLFLQGSGIDLLQLTLVANTRVLNLFMSTAFFTFSTDVFALLKAMKRVRLPESLYLPVYVLFRFLPEIEGDLLEIRGIQKIRGIRKRQPVLYLKSILIPLLFTVLQKSDELAIAYYLRKQREQR